MAVQAQPADSRPKNTRACALCGASAVEPVLTRGAITIVRCPGCGLQYRDAIPSAEELAALYSEDYYRSSGSLTVGYDDYLADAPNVERTFRRRLRLLGRYVPGPGRLLDVGCATGAFMRVARDAGWETVGVDISEYSIRVARETAGLDARHGEVSALGLPDESFDLVVLWDVIEHFPDPLRELQEVARLLKAGGIMALTTPDLASLPARLLGRRWIGYSKLEEHLFYFSRSTMGTLLRRAGVELVSSRTEGKWVAARLLASRAGYYCRPLERAVLGVCRLAHIEDLYVDPLDMMLVVARKPAGS